MSLCAQKRAAALAMVVGLLAGFIVTVVTPGLAAAAAGDITSVAGGGIGDGGQAATARVGNPIGITVDSAGNVFFVDQESNSVRRVGTDGVITRVAGIGFPGFSGDGGSATQAQLNSPYDVAVAADGTLFIADYGNGRIRKVTPGGTITTLAGTGVLADSGDGGPATAAELTPIGVAVDDAGNVFFSDQFSYRVRRIDTAGTIHAFAGQLYSFDYPWDAGDGGPAVDAQIQSPFGLDVDAAGNVFIADSANGRIRKVDTAGVIHTVAGVTDDFSFYGDGGPATEAGFSLPVDVDVHPSGRLFVSDQINNRIRQIVPGADGVVSGEADEIVTTVAGNGDFTSSSGDGGPAVDASIPQPNGVVADGAGNLYVSDTRGHAVRRVDAATQIITNFAGRGEGDGGAATNALLTRPYGVATSGSEQYFSEGEPQLASDETLGNRVRKIDATGTITTVAGNGQTGFAGDGGPATAALLSDPRGVAFDAGGHLYIADCRNGRVRHVTPGGTIGTVAGGGSPSDGVGDGAAATAAALSCPSGVEVDTTGAGAGALYIADADSHRVRRVGPGADGVVNGGGDETITTVAGTGTAGSGGDGGPAKLAQVRFPSQALDGIEHDPGPDVTVDGAGNVYVADEGNHRVRRVGAGADGVVDGSPDEAIATVAGNGTVGVGVDGVAATTQPVNGPGGVAIDGAGRLVIAETKFGRVRRVDAAGIISTIAGTGFPGYSGDGGPATAAQLSYPTHVAYDPAGNLFITDRGNALVRMVEPGTPAPPPPAAKKKECGAVVTKNTTLKADIGPCPGDGIVVGADNITIDLAGHRILGTGMNQDAAGIRLRDRTGVTIRGGATKGPRPRRSAMGTVSGFAGGVAIIGGSHNTVTGLNVQGNIGGGQLGDGIAIFFSPHNRILDNVVVDNGIYDGIGVLGIGSDHNLISGNLVDGTTTDGASGQGIGLGIVLNPFLDLSYPRQVTHTGNRVVGNTARDNAAAGMSTLGNTHGVVARNTTLDNGFGTVFPPGNGIGIQSLLQTPPETDMLVESNHSHGNARSGIEVLSRRNTIRGNNAAGNRVAPSFFPASDLRDGHPTCADNLWDANVWGSGGFSPACTAAGGHEQVGPLATIQSSANQNPPPAEHGRKHPPKPR